MARVYKRMEDFKENSLQNEITDKIGNNKTNEKYFDNDITIIQKMVLKPLDWVSIHIED
jgi:hypothetical protein